MSSQLKIEANRRNAPLKTGSGHQVAFGNVFPARFPAASQENPNPASTPAS